MCVEPLEVIRRGIPFVPGEPVLRVQLIQLVQVSIARCFRKYGSSGNRLDFAVSLDDGLRENTDFWAMQAIDKHLVRQDMQAFHRTLHGKQARLQDIDGVDLLHATACHTPGKRMFPDLQSQAVAFLFG